MSITAAGKPVPELQPALELQPVLELKGIGKQFGAIRALHGVDLAVQPGEVIGLMGDNGAGKSTLVRIIAGNFPPSQGTLHFDRREVQFHRPVDSRAVGIEVVYQDLALANNLTAAANVFLGRELKRSFGPLRLLDHKAMEARALELFRELRSETRPESLVKDMSGGQRQAVAIARTRLSNAKLVMMDEPTAAISVRQVEQVLGLIHRLKEQGIAVMLISHRMPDIFAVCDRVVVMRRGEKKADKPVTETSPEEVTALITGAKEAA
jgi:simple sugar transport system ATP-binding protein